MPETTTRTDSPSKQEPATPWQMLLHDVEQYANVIADEITTDSVLGDSITLSVSAYLKQRDKLEAIRVEFADADLACSNLRRDVDAVMRTHGFESGWSSEEVGTVDAQLVVGMIYAAEKAGEVNKRRIEADALNQQLLDRAVDEVALCANIAVLRQVERFTCPGEAFCVAYIAAAILREKTTEDVPLSVGIRTLSEWLQYSIGVKTRATELDIYAHNRVASGIGKGMGIENSNALRLALIEAMKKLNVKKAP
jgi:hypothetical protein